MLMPEIFEESYQYKTVNFKWYATSAMRGSGDEYKQCEYESVQREVRRGEN